MTLDYSKFRFRIGDIINWNGKQYKILAYYFLKAFNDFSGPYGYTIKVEKGYTGSDASYDDKGNKLSEFPGYCFYISEKSAEAIISQNYTYSSDFSKAKPGDKVIVKPLVHPSLDYQFGVNELMKEMEGEIKTIRTIKKTDVRKEKLYPANYEIFVEEDEWTWSDAMLKLVEKTDNIVSESIKTLRTGVTNFLKKKEINIEIIVKKKKPKLIFNL